MINRLVEQRIQKINKDIYDPLTYNNKKRGITNNFKRWSKTNRKMKFSQVAFNWKNTANEWKTNVCD